MSDRGRSRSASSSSSSSSSSGSDSSSPEDLAPGPVLIKNLRKHGPPDTIMVFRDTEGLVYETLDRVEQSNIPRVLGYNYMFTKALKKVKSREDFIRVLLGHIANIETLCRLNRREATDDLRRRKVVKGRLSRNVFAIRKRVAVWRDAMRSIERMATQDGASWTDGYRSMLYRRLIPAERTRWYCCHILATVQDMRTVSSVRFSDED